MSRASGKRGRVHIGTSGWHYSHWRGPFYPADLQPSRFLEYYVGRFTAAEINNSFYKLPEEQTLADWRKATPDGFVFAVKGSRYITHMKKLKEGEKSVPHFLDRVKVLGQKLGPILFQLPPQWRRNVDRLDEFLSALPNEYSYAFEFRDSSWFADEVNQALAAKNAAFCVYDFDGRESPRTVTADFAYVRLHGPDGPYQGQYDEGTLRDWAGVLHDWAGQGKDVFCFFDNDEAGYAAQDALRLKQMVHRLQSR
ncbi:MAG: DUF72 domain-containing protein [Chloroflexota bacterium]